MAAKGKLAKLDPVEPGDDWRAMALAKGWTPRDLDVWTSLLGDAVVVGVGTSRIRVDATSTLEILPGFPFTRTATRYWTRHDPPKSILVEPPDPDAPALPPPAPWCHAHGDGCMPDADGCGIKDLLSLDVEMCACGRDEHRKYNCAWIALMVAQREGRGAAAVEAAPVAEQPVAFGAAFVPKGKKSKRDGKHRLLPGQLKPLL